MKRSLLIISCSGAKDETPGLLPAVMRYKGPLYPTLHKAIRENRFPNNLDILIVSAKYGLLKSDESIGCYDQEINDERARELRPNVQKKLEAFLDGKDYDQLFNGLWQAYNKTLEGFDLEKHFTHVIPVENNRGKKMRQLKTWIVDLFEKEQSK